MIVQENTPCFFHVCFPLPSRRTGDGRRSKASPASWILPSRCLGPGRVLVHPQTFPRPCPIRPSPLHFLRVLHPRLRHHSLSGPCPGSQVRPGQSQRERLAQDLLYPDVCPLPSIAFVVLTRSLPQSRESGSRVRFSIHTVLDSLHPVRFLQRLRR
jgi:hypothetical protein